MIKIKRAYEPPSSEDGWRVLVDRLWPRGLSRDDAAIEAWAKDLAPSAALRRWFAGDIGRWPEFSRRYRAELAAPALSESLADLRAKARGGVVTLLFAKRDEEHNNAAVLRDHLAAKLPRSAQK